MCYSYMAKYEILGTGIGYDEDKYRAARSLIRSALRGVNDLPVNVRDEVYRLLGMAVRGTYCATREIYNPLLDPKKQAIVEGSSNDYHTDMECLEELVNRV